MKSVSLSQVVRAQQSYRLASPVQSWRELAALALTLSVGLVAIVIVLMALDPGAPAMWIVAPVLLGGSLPLVAALPGQFDVVTRFDAAHFLKTLDVTLREMGYAATDSLDGRSRSYQRPARLFRWKDSTVTLRLQEHAVSITGPMPALRRLQQRLGA
ncbi:MAG: hypothetical protein ACJ8HI_06790 [Massilia sp.]